MKKLIFAVFIIIAALKLCFIPTVSAQTAPSYNIDTDILAIRNISIPSFQWHYDDYLQYAPAALMVGMKACGYESRSSWGRMLASDAFSAGVMAIAVNSLKYSIGRLRPDGTSYNSFPSGHTATAFMTASMLHMEYGWRSPWFSIGGYAAAAVTGVSRIMNNRHWMTDVVAGAAIGIGSTYLGYFLADLIFKDRSLNEGYGELPFHFDPSRKHYDVDLLFGRRFVLGAQGMKDMETLPIRGGMAGISTEIPIVPDAGVTAQFSASSLTYRSGHMTDLYSCLAGGYWNFCFAKIMMLQTKVMAGYAWLGSSPATGAQSGLALNGGVDLNLITGNNFKVKAFAELESINLSSQAPWLNTAIVGFGTGFFW